MRRGHRTGLWFQMARGRAMVRNRAMREARQWKNRLVTVGAGAAWSRMYDEQACYDNMVAAVRRARAAHRDWRKYRALDAENVAADQAIDRAFDRATPAPERERLVAELRAKYGLSL